ncbi:SWI/SNF-related matrix-associated actin-dependent regulator of chromatin subfamily A member 5 [Enteropsectra breve]|nr:SWI/SNF-related matrix-associated actin-dependent regulator of chromatin subfamily A member 5 [Enteropsectra breve]
MASKTLQRYIDFIDDDEFVKAFKPHINRAVSSDEPVELFTFTKSPEYISVEMRPYQIEGLNWLVKMHENGINCILADEMGLGKTLQSISLLGYIKCIKNERSKHLIIVPKSCLQNWANEFARFVPELRVMIFHTSKADIPNEAHELLSKKYDVILTTYEMCIFAKNIFRKIAWSYVVVDEAHRLKNENSQLSQILRMYDFKHRLLLTGTPLQNNIHELWALLNFIIPELFDDAARFEAYVVSGDEQEKSLEKLRNVLQLFFLRREKMDVEHSLMAKKFINIYCPLTEMQRVWYQSILKKDLSNVSINGSAKASLLNVVMQLKKCCNHPYLFLGAEPEPFETGEHLITNSGKLVVLDKLLLSLKQKGSRVLVFSQMSNMIDILEDYVQYRGFEYCRIDGSTTSEDRTSAINAFNEENSTKFVFLLTTRAGGLGINLYTADSVVIFDSDWNPQADLQAQDRAHRIGQKKQVHVFRFITENSVEEGIVLRAQQKLKLDDILIQKGQNRSSNAITHNELMDILVMGLDSTQGPKEDVEMDIEDIIRKGQEKTAEMNAKIQDFKIGEMDTKINLYQWEGQNYAKRKLEEFVEENQEEEERSVRSTLFSSKKFKPMEFPEYQFYPQEFYELQKKEEELFNNGIGLSAEDKELKEKYLSEGFNWTKKDYRAFVQAVEMHGQNIDAIRPLFAHRKDFEKYYEAFWKNLDNLSEGERIKGILERNAEKNDKKEKLRKIFEQHMDSLEEYLLTKNKLYTDNIALLKLYYKYIDDANTFEKVKLEICKSDQFIFDYYLRSRTPSELGKHIGMLAAQALKAFDHLYH